jgi:hypothetical protein
MRRRSPLSEFPTPAPDSAGVGRNAGLGARSSHTAVGVGQTGVQGGCLLHSGPLPRRCGAKRRPGRLLSPVTAGRDACLSDIRLGLARTGVYCGCLPHTRPWQRWCGTERRPGRPFVPHRRGCGANRRAERLSAPQRPLAALVWDETASGRGDFPGRCGRRTGRAGVAQLDVPGGTEPPGGRSTKGTRQPMGGTSAYL